MKPEWNALLDVPVFVINMDRCVERWEKARANIAAAGFRNIQRWKAVDAENDNITEAWARHGSPLFDPSDEEFVKYPGKQGCMLSHLDIFQHVLKEKIPWCIIFEDDVFFHEQWDELAHAYWHSTPADAEVVYMGSQLDAPSKNAIDVVPVFCTHAYALSYSGIEKMYRLLLGQSSGVRTIDCILIDLMKNHLYRGGPRWFHWYVWNGLLFMDQRAFEHKDWAKRNTGLVFQDPTMGTYVRPW